MTNHSLTHAQLLLITVFAFVTGCASDDSIPVSPVKGMVNFDGKPLGGALIYFQPRSSDIRGASGRTLDDGSFQLSTMGATRSGAMVGEYAVTIQKEAEVDATGKPIERATTEYSPVPTPQVRGKVVSVVPGKYGDVATSGLEAKVTQGSNSFEFNLSK